MLGSCSSWCFSALLRMMLIPNTYETKMVIIGVTTSTPV